MEQEAYKPKGMHVRAVVLTTYTYDDPAHPEGDFGNTDKPAEPSAIYCDVLGYSDTAGARWWYLPGVLVSQDRGGLHSGRIWKPKATKGTLSGAKLNPNLTNPSDMDGDHVLVGFFDESYNSPVILRALPHPARDPGNINKQAGHRLQLKIEDGDPDLWKHHGTFFGVEDNGSFVVDTTHANDGVLIEKGEEAAPPTDGKGGQTFRMPLGATDFNIAFVVPTVDGTDPEEKVTLKFSKDRMQISFADANVTMTQTIDKFEVKLDGETLLAQGKDGAATLKVGDGAKSVAIAEQLEIFYTALQTKLTAFDAHVHPTGVGPSGPPAPLIAAGSWDSAIASTKVKIPGN
jgi:hypothetical protein